MEIKWIFNTASSFNKLWNKRYYQNEPRFNGVYSRNNLPEKVKDGPYVINFDEYADIGTHWITLFCRKNEIIYFDSFGAEHVPAEIKKFTGNKNIKADIFRVQSNDSIMCEYFCIGFIDFMLSGKKNDWFYEHVFYSWSWKKWQHNFALFQRWMKLIKQTWLIKQNLDWIK